MKTHHVLVVGSRGGGGTLGKPFRIPAGKIGEL